MPAIPMAARTHVTDLLHLPLAEAGPTASAAWGPLLLREWLRSCHEAAIGACHGAAEEEEQE